MFRPLPPIDPVTETFWEGCQQKRLLIQKCASCGAWNFYPRAFCKSCHGEDLEYVGVSGRGSVYSYTVVHRAPGKAFASQVPYAVALVDLEEGVRLLTNIVDCSSIEIGMEVAVVFLETDDGFRIPAFAPAHERGRKESENESS